MRAARGTARPPAGLLVLNVVILPHSGLREP